MVFWTLENRILLVFIEFFVVCRLFLNYALTVSRKNDKRSARLFPAVFGGRFSILGFESSAEVAWRLESADDLYLAHRHL